MTKKAVNSVSPKLQFFMEVSNAVNSCRDEILATKQIIPWAGDRNGPAYAVTTRQVVGSLENLLTELRSLVASANIEPSSLPQGIFKNLDPK
jgi:hypothetical protein